MREVLMAVAPEIVEASDREDEAERARLQAQEAEPDEPEPDPPAPSDPPQAPALPSNVVRYHSVRRGPNGEHPAHYLKHSESTFEVPYFPLDPTR
jgi:hypothetical protein